MPQSLVKNFIHLIFSTKNRQSFISTAIESELHAYLGGICKQLNCPIIIVGGSHDHIHMLFALHKGITLVEAVKQIKMSSSKWIKSKGSEFQNFFWQGGYGAFSVNPREIDIVIEYIKNQRQHHQKKSFEDEYRAFLTQYQVSFDERYVWD